MYVDGVRTPLTASCETVSATSTYPCSAPLPSLTSGPHTLELATFIVEGGTVLESSRSAPFRVTVSGAAPTQSPSQNASRPSRATTLDTRGTAVTLDVLADSLHATDIAVTPDGRVLAGDASGRVIVVDQIRDATQTALQIDGRVVSLAVDPQFARTHLVFVAAASPAPDGATSFSVARYREVSNTLGDQAVIVDGVRASTATRAVVRFGPDRVLYAAFDDGGDSGLGGDLGSWNGKVLRLNADGSTPRDQAGGSPVYAWPFRAPAGLAWDPVGTALWVADAHRPGPPQLDAVFDENGNGRRGVIEKATALPQAVDVFGVAFSQAGLLLAAGGRGLLRVELRPDDRTRVLRVERLLPRDLTVAHAVAVDGDGTIYVGTDTNVIRIAADRATRSRR